jgi:protease-4
MEDRTLVRTIVAVFVAFVLGFMLPVCSCVGTGWLAVRGLAGMAPTDPQALPALGDSVAVLRLNGVIASSGGTSLYSTGVSPTGVAEALEQAAANRSIKAVVVRVNSPGGSVVASDEIYRAFLEFEKPIVISMGEMAASGGYYVACGADYVLAHPGTLTGSIGVISEFYNLEELLDEIGVDVFVISSGPTKDFGSPYREMTEEERGMWEAVIDETYESFVSIVAEARDLPLADVRALADGRVYTGQQALELGLVDGLGTLDDAIAKAAELGGIAGEPYVVELQQPQGLFELLYGFQSDSGLPSLEEIIDWAGRVRLEYRFTGE